MRLRVGPFSIGAVNTSPRATNRARSPFGLSSKSSICPAADTRAGRDATPSSGTTIGIGRDSPLSMANRCSSPFISYTIRLRPSSPGHRTSHCVLSVSCVVSPVSTSNAYRFRVPSRSDVK